MNIVRSAEPTQKSTLVNVLRVIAILLLVGIGVALASYLGVRGTMSGSKTQLAGSIFLALLPLLLYLALERPFIFPFALFVVAVPIDNLLGINNLYSNAAVSSTEHVATLTKYLGLASGLAFILWLIRNRQYVKPPTAAFLWFAVLIWMALSVFWALDTTMAFGFLATYAELIALFFVVAVMPVTRVDLQLFVGATVIGALVTAAWSIYQYRVGGGVLHAALNQALIANHHFKSESAAIDPNALTAALLLPIALVLTAYLQRRWSLAKLALAVILVVLLGGAYVVASRGGIVGLFVMFGYLAFRSRHRMQIIALSLMALLASLAGGVSSGSIWGRFADAARNGGSGRTYIWRVGWDAFKHHALFGAGVGNFPVAYNRSFIHIFEFIDEGWNRASHNTPLGLAVEIGIIGLLLSMFAAYFQFRMLAFIKRSDPLHDFRIGLESAFIGLFTASVFLWVMPGKYTWLTFMLMAATRSFALCRPAWRPRPAPGRVDLAHDDVHPSQELRVPLNV